jgi:hypothetical protein
MWSFDLSRIPRVVTEPEMGVKEPECHRIARAAPHAKPARANGEVRPSGARDFQFKSRVFVSALFCAEVEHCEGIAAKSIAECCAVL